MWTGAAKAVFELYYPPDPLIGQAGILNTQIRQYHNGAWSGWVDFEGVAVICASRIQVRGNITNAAGASYGVASASVSVVVTPIETAPAQVAIANAADGVNIRYSVAIRRPAANNGQCLKRGGWRSERL